MKTERDEISDELLSAYLDGEVSSDERQQVAHRLAASDEDRRKLAALEALRAELRNLPRVRLAAEVHERILRAVERVAAERAAPQDEDRLPVLGVDPEVLSAYYDGETTDDERRAVDQARAEDAGCGRALDQIRQLDVALRQLSVFALDDGFADRVRQRIERESLVAASSVEPAVEHGGEPAVEHAPQRTASSNRAVRGSRTWRALTWSAVALAASLALMVYLQPDFEPTSPRGIIDSAGHIAGVGSAGVDSASVDGTGLELASPDGHSPLRLVNRRLRDQLLLVYEVTLTPEGVRKGAFLRLLKRRGISITNTVAVPEQEQRELLKCQFLRGVQSVGAGEAGDIDRVQLFLVHSTARQAEAMYDELVHRPEGCASFSINLTTRQAGRGILERLAVAAGRRGLGDGVQLAGNFGMLSKVGRRVGRFGTVSYVDPDLLARPNSSSNSPASDAIGEPIEARSLDAPRDDFRCELLFVVRYLRPLSQDDEPRTLSMANDGRALLRSTARSGTRPQEIAPSWTDALRRVPPMAATTERGPPAVLAIGHRSP